MTQLGFTNYNITPAPVELTIKEILAGLTGKQEAVILDGFAKRVPASEIVKVLFLKENVIQHLYNKINEVQMRSRSLMRKEVEITPAETDPETGEITTPAVMNTRPATQTELNNSLISYFSDDLTEIQVTAIVTKMIKFSNGGNATWTYYKSNVIL